MFELVWQIMNTTLFEWVALFTSLFFIMFLTSEHKLSWPIGIISAEIHFALCVEYDLFIESGIQFFFVIMYFVGWIIWRRSVRTYKRGANLVEYKAKTEGKLLIQRWRIEHHIILLISSVSLTAVLGFALDSLTNQMYPYTDAFVATFGLAATYLTARKVLESWVYWMIINSIITVLNIMHDFYLAALFYGASIFVCIVGLRIWFKRYQWISG